MEIQELFDKIETWDRQTVRSALRVANRDKNLEDALFQRYEEILDFMGENSLGCLDFLPQSLFFGTMSKEWEPSEETIQILGGLGVETLYFTEKILVPSWIGHLKKLKTLVFARMKCINLPDSIGLLPNLRKVCFESVPLKSIPSCLFNLNLDVLKIYDAPIESYPENWGHLSSLKSLELNYCSLLPTRLSIKDLINLEELELNGNELSELPPDVSELKNLKSLTLHNNRFQKVPDCLRKLEKITSLTLGKNPLETLPDWMENWSNLEVLNLDQTLISSLPPYLSQFPHLSYLDIRLTPLHGKAGFYKTQKNRKLVEALLNSLQDNKDQEILSDLYKDLESFDESRISKALNILKEDQDKRAAAEERYLSFIQVRLGGADHSIFDFPRAALTPREADWILKGDCIGEDNISFIDLSDEESRLIVDLLGSFVYGRIDMDNYCDTAKWCEDDHLMWDWFNYSKAPLIGWLCKELAVGAEGWFQAILQKLSTLSLSEVRIVRSRFKSANESPYLREFFFFLQVLEGRGSMEWTITESDAPDLTELFWFSYLIPLTTWIDMEPRLPFAKLRNPRKARVSKKTGLSGRERSSKNNPSSDPFLKFEKTLKAANIDFFADEEEKSLAKCRKILQQEPCCFPAKILESRCLYYLDQNDEALSEIEKIIDTPLVKQSEVFSMVASFYKVKKKYNRATVYAKKAVIYAKKSFFPNFTLSRLEALRGNVEGANKYLIKAWEINPEKTETSLIYESDFDGIRETPEFQKVLSRIKL